MNTKYASLIEELERTASAYAKLDAAASAASAAALKEMSDLVRAHISFDDLEIK